jgi:hypothetical protein
MTDIPDKAVEAAERAYRDALSRGWSPLAAIEHALRAALPHLVAPGGALVPRELLIEAAEACSAFATDMPGLGYSAAVTEYHRDLARRLRSAAGAAEAAGDS